MTLSYQEPTYAVFGDVGGHSAPFIAGLRRLGVRIDLDTGEYSIPASLTVVQAGDIIHKGPDSDLLVTLADGMMQQNNDNPARGNWVQLIGNHESNYIPGARVFWPESCNKESIKTIRRWWKNNEAKLHFLIPQNSGKPFMVTHAGVSSFLYKSTQRKNKGIDAFETYLNSLQPGRMMEASFAGAMLYGKISAYAGVFWAHSTHEVYSTWRDSESPFHQIHGHCPPFSWMFNGFYPNIHPVYQKEILLDKIHRHSLWQMNNSDFYCLDPGFNEQADIKEMSPLILTHNGLISK